MWQPEIESTKANSGRPHTGSSTLVGWLFCFLLAIPAITLVCFSWRIFFAPEVHLWAFVAGLALGFPFTAITLARARKLIHLGLHPYWRHGVPSGLGVRFKVYSFFVAVAYAWVLVFTGASVAFPAYASQRKSFEVTELSECTGSRCSLCTFRIKLEGWLSAGQGELCVDEDVWRVLKRGSKVVVSGIFSNYAYYSASVENAH